MQIEVSSLRPWLLEVDGCPLDLPENLCDALSGRLALLSDDIASQLRQHDLYVIPSYADAVTLVDLAASLIDEIPDLASILYRCVHEIIVLRPPDDAYDVSHSDPRWATRIFVSIPGLSETAPLRVAEAIVHEAMHLNLTFLERRAELASTTRTLYSPWKTEPRPALGVLHGVYVFGCIHSFLRHLCRAHRFSEQQENHIRKRLADICGEVALIDRPQLLSCLSANGVSVAEGAFAAIDG